MKKHTTCTHPATPAARAACRRNAAVTEVLTTEVSAVNEVEIFHRRNRIQDQLRIMTSTWSNNREKYNALREELAALPMTDVKARRIDAGVWDLYTGDVIVGRLTREEYMQPMSRNNSRLTTHYKKRVRFTYNGSDRGYRLDVGQYTLTTALAVMNGRTDA